MKPFTLAAAQISAAAGDVASNLAHHRVAILAAARLIPLLTERATWRVVALRVSAGSSGLEPF